MNVTTPFIFFISVISKILIICNKIYLIAYTVIGLGLNFFKILCSFALKWNHLLTMALLRLHDLKDSMLEMYHNTSSYFSWNTLALYGGVIGGTWIAYKAFIEPFLSPLRQVISHMLFE